MAEEFHAGICGDTWWNSSKTMFAGCSSPGIVADTGSFGWSVADTVVDIKARSCFDESNKYSLDFQPGAAQLGDSDSCGGAGMLIDSALQMVGFGLSSSTISDWNRSLIQQETTMDSSRIQKDWSPRSYTSPGEDSCITTFKPINHDFSSEHQILNSVVTSSGNGTQTCRFPMSSSVSYENPSLLSKSLFEPDPQPQSLFDNRRSINYMSTETAAYGANNDWQKLASFVRPSSVKQQPGSLQFANDTSFWNASATCVNDVGAGFSPTQPESEFLLQTFEEKTNYLSLTKMTNADEARSSMSATKKGSSDEPPLLKRPRIETPSSLPTFKLRKEKLGDRITALQQLVSPFGKTDTASVLHEANEYIKFLHDQVTVLSTPYMKQAAASTQQQQSIENSKDPERTKHDLRSLGICLVPISSTFPVVNETTLDFWSPTFGVTLR